mgnify:CR=1 FL=1|jgi:glycosyltransferase involved in cell wall biosynthesis
MSSKNISILGIRGIPANHGGFETFAERLALFLVKNNWDVTVFCQVKVGKKIHEEYWNKVRLVKIPIKTEGSLGTILFDFKTVLFTRKHCSGIVLTLGYNTAIFNCLLKIKNIINIINMDGLEWKRRKYNFIQKLWLYINEKTGAFIADHLIADNPEIEKRLKIISNKSKKITMLPYGAEIFDIKSKDEYKILNDLNIVKPYLIIIARPVEENNIYEIVKAFSKKKRNHKLLVFGDYNKKVFYQKKVLDIASKEVIFLGAIYDLSILTTIRKNAKLYIHGHSVGGTNPALVEAMSCALPILAHNNPFNKWVAGLGSEFFNNDIDFEKN